jgi:putative Mg2+ transporter-C (MgtC) family protein
MNMQFISPYLAMVDPLTFVFLKGLGISIVLGYIMGAERELRGKDAGISTHIFVITGSMLFTVLSMVVDPASKSRIAAQIVSGIGFLGAGLILKDGLGVRNLTTAASLWFSAAVGMTIGYGYYVIAIVSGIAAVFIPRIRHVKEEPFIERDKEVAPITKTKRAKAKA